MTDKGDNVYTIKTNKRNITKFEVIDGESLNRNRSKETKDIEGKGVLKNLKSRNDPKRR